MKSEPRIPLLSLTCREASRLISESLDRELTRRERWSLWIHTLLCNACKRFAHQTKMIRVMMTNIPVAFREKFSTGLGNLTSERRTQIKRLLNEARQAESQE